MYACVCDWLGFPYREEVQWVSTCLFWSPFQLTVEVVKEQISHNTDREGKGNKQKAKPKPKPATL